MTWVHITELYVCGFHGWGSGRDSDHWTEYFIMTIKQLSFLRQANDSSDCMWVATSGSWSESNEFGQADLILSRAMWRLHLSYDTITAAWLTVWQQRIGRGALPFLDWQEKSLTVKWQGSVCLREHVFILTRGTAKCSHTQPVAFKFVQYASWCHIWQNYNFWFFLFCGVSPVRWILKKKKKTLLHLWLPPLEVKMEGDSKGWRRRTFLIDPLHGEELVIVHGAHVPHLPVQTLVWDGRLKMSDHDVPAEKTNTFQFYLTFVISH